MTKHGCAFGTMGSTAGCSVVSMSSNKLRSSWLQLWLASTRRTKIADGSPFAPPQCIKSSRNDPLSISLAWRGSSSIQRQSA